jgi:hypothetical protein
VDSEIRGVIGDASDDPVPAVGSSGVRFMRGGLSKSEHSVPGSSDSDHRAISSCSALDSSGDRVVIGDSSDSGSGVD